MSKIIVILALIAILVSLGSGLYFMMKDHDDSERMVKALTVRIILSLALFVFLLLGYYFGWLQPGNNPPY